MENAKIEKSNTSFWVDNNSLKMPKMDNFWKPEAFDQTSGRPIHRFADASADASADAHRPMVPSVFSKPSADGFYFKNHRFSEKMAEKDHLGNILRK